MPENYSDIPLLLHLKLREIEIIVLYVRNNVCTVIRSLFTVYIPLYPLYRRYILYYQG